MRNSLIKGFTNPSLVHTLEDFFQITDFKKKRKDKTKHTLETDYIRIRQCGGKLFKR